MFLVLWEYEVKAECEERFQQIYNQNGDWVKLFCTDPSFEKTVLVRDPSRAHVFLTLDFWHSRDAYHSFKKVLHSWEADAGLEVLTATVVEVYAKQVHTV